MTSRAGKIQGKRYDAFSEILIGPESKKIKLSDIANDTIISQCQKVPTYSQSLTSTQEEALAKRCSVYELQTKVKDATDDKQLASELRSRFLTWIAEGVPEHAETFRLKRKQKEDGRMMDETDREVGDDNPNNDSHYEGEANVEQLLNPIPLHKVQDKVPDAFKFMANPALASAYHQQGGRLDGSTITGPTPTESLKTIYGCTSAGGKRSIADKGSNPLILQISIYSRPPRGMWAKEKFDRVVRSVHESEYQFGEGGSETQDNATWQNGEKYEIPERTKRGPDFMLGRSGPYESLQLTQRILIRSDATLKDLRDGFYCRMDEIPESVDEEEKFKIWKKQVALGDLSSAAPQKHQYTGQKRKTDSCFLIEDILYSANSNEAAYASLLSAHFSKPNEDGAPPRAIASERSMTEVTIDSLELCTGKMYWFLHQGSCEHLWTIDSVRLARDEESKRPSSETLTTFLRNGSLISPIVRWSRPVKREESFSIGLCHFCERQLSFMNIVGGERFRPLNQKETCKGLREDNVGICDKCWYTLNGDNVEFARAGGEGWTVIPLMY